MSVNRAEFSVAVKSTFDSSGVDAAKTAYNVLAVQLKAMQADIAQAQRTGVSIPQSALDEVSKLEKSIANLGHVASEAGVKTHEVKEALHLVGNAAAGALGPLGELGHFLENPYVLAAAGAIAAMTMLVAQYDALRENTLKNITASEEQADQWRNGFVTAANEASNALNNYSIRLAHARDSVDLLAEAQRNQVALAQQHAEAIERAADAQERLNVARIREQETLGNISSPEASYAIEQAHRQQRAARDQAADLAAGTDINSRIDQANAERQLGTAASARQPGERQAVQHAASMLNGATTRLNTATTALVAANKNLNVAKTNSELPDARIIAEGTRRAVAELDPRLLNPATAGMAIAEQVAKIQAEELATATNQQQTAQRYFAAQTALVEKYREQTATAQKDLDKDEELAVAKQLLYDQIMREVGQRRAVQTSTVTGRTAVERTDDQAYTVIRRTELLKKLQDGTITTAERAELQGMADVNHTGGVNPRTGQYQPPELGPDGRPRTVNSDAGHLADIAARGEAAILQRPPDARNQSDVARIATVVETLIGMQREGHITDSSLSSRIDRIINEMMQIQAAQRTLQQRIDARGPM